jgi:hypothetical protein
MVRRWKYGLGMTGVGFAIAAIFLVLPVAASTPDDPNVSAGHTAVLAPEPALPPSSPGGGRTIATVLMPAPSTSTESDFTVVNLSSLSTVGAQNLTVLIVDCFDAFQNNSLTIDSVFDVIAPPGGAATVTTGNGALDVGPAVLRYTNFNDGEASAFTLDPDTFGNAGFGATRLQMAGCRFEAVFAGANTLRGEGVMVHDPATDMMVAFLQQTNP